MGGLRGFKLRLVGELGRAKRPAAPGGGGMAPAVPEGIGFAAPRVTLGVEPVGAERCSKFAAHR